MAESLDLEENPEAIVDITDSLDFGEYGDSREAGAFLRTEDALCAVAKHKANRSKYCEICYLNEEFESLRVCQNCDASVCHSCFKSWLTSKVFSGYASISRLRCIGCSVEITPQELSEVTGERTYRKYQYFISRGEHRNDPNAIWCAQDGCWKLLSSSASKENSQLLKRGQRRKPPVAQNLRCDRCDSETCSICSEIGHPDQPCAIPRSDVGKRVGAKMVKSLTTKKCPNPACKAPIQRSSGCKHIHCLACQAHFCWRCRGSIADFSYPVQRGRPCACQKVHATAVYVTIGSGILLVLPIVGALGVVVGPPALLWYCAISKERRLRMKNRFRSLSAAL